jgi:hypothetical protein
VAERSPTFSHFPLPASDQASALPIAGASRSRVGIQTVMAQLGRPPLHGDTTLLVSSSNCLLTGAARCAGLAARSDHWAET